MDWGPREPQSRVERPWKNAANSWNLDRFQQEPARQVSMASLGEIRIGTEKWVKQGQMYPVLRLRASPPGAHHDT